MPTISTLTVDVQSRTSRFSKGLAVAIGGLAALATGAAFAFKKFEESENVMQQTDAVIKSTGSSANVTAKQVSALADSLSRKAGVDDEVIQAGQNMLLTFKNISNEAGRNNDIFNQASVAAVDMAAGFAAASGSEINLKAATIQLGKALNDPIAGMSALTRVGVQFSEQQQNVITKLVESGNLMQAQKIILAEVTSQFQGSAEANATASGKMQVAFENLVETIGGALAPVMTTIINALIQFASFLQENVGPALKATWEAIQPVAEVVGAVLAPAFEVAWHAVRDKLLPALEDLMPIFKVIGLAVVAFVTVMAVQFAIAITVISTVIDIIGEIVKAFMKVVDWVRENLAEPIVGALEKVLDFIGKVAGEIKEGFLAAWNAVKGPVLAVIGSFIAAIQTLIGWIQDAIRWVSQLGQGVSGALAEAGVAEGVFSPVRPPGAAAGGFVQRSGLAVIHQGENIIPAGMGGFGGDIVLQVDGQTFARITRDQLRRFGNRNAGTGLN